MRRGRPPWPMTRGSAAPGRVPSHSCELKLPCNPMWVRSPTGSPATPRPPAAPYTNRDSRQHWASDGWSVADPSSFAVVRGHPPSGHVWCIAVCVCRGPAATRLPPLPRCRQAPRSSFLHRPIPCVCRPVRRGPSRASAQPGANADWSHVCCPPERVVPPGFPPPCCRRVWVHCQGT